MNTRNRNIFIIFCVFVLITACSNQLSIKSVSDDKVVISGPPEEFVNAFGLAKKQCEKNNKFAQYVPDETASLQEVTFNCVGEEAAVEPQIDTESQTETPTEMETEVMTEDETGMEADTVTEEITSE